MKIFFGFAVMLILLASPKAYAFTVTFSPASPQVYDGTSDVNTSSDLTSGAGGCSGSTNDRIAFFKPDGNKFVTNSSMYWCTSTGMFNYAETANFQAMAGSYGDVTYYAFHDTGAERTACVGASATASGCAGAGGVFIGTYTLCNGSCGGGGGGGGSSSTPITLSTTTPNGGGTLFTTMLEWWGVGAVQLALIFMPIIIVVAALSRRLRRVV